MATLLCIDTAGETAIVGLGNEDSIFASATNPDQKNHASFVQPAIQNILADASISFADINAVAVVNGPGSYTGIRVGLATAKGICYALNKSLIVLNTLTVMAAAAMKYLQQSDKFYCPLIDARRNEVFTAVYDVAMHEQLSPQPLILEPDSFSIFLNQRKTVFFGSGHKKCGKTIKHENAIFADISYSVKDINELAQRTYQNGDFADIAYIEPFYTKDFFSPG